MTAKASLPSVIGRPAKCVKVELPVARIDIRILDRVEWESAALPYHYGRFAQTPHRTGRAPLNAPGSPLYCSITFFKIHDESFGGNLDIPPVFFCALQS